MEVSVRDNNVDQALRALKKKLQREGVFREMKPVGTSKAIPAPQARKGRSCCRYRKVMRKRMEREGF